MSNNITYDYLWNAYQKERQGNQLLPLTKSFYSDAQEFISGLGAGDTKANSIGLLNSLAEKRRQKILMYVAYGKPLPQQVDDTEQELYDKLVALVKGSSKESASIKSANKVTLKVIKDIPEVILPSGGRAGPLRSNQMIELDSKDGADIEFLVTNAICERL